MKRPIYTHFAMAEYQITFKHHHAQRRTLQSRFRCKDTEQAESVLPFGLASIDMLVRFYIAKILLRQQYC